MGKQFKRFAATGGVWMILLLSGCAVTSHRAVQKPEASSARDIRKAQYLFLEAERQKLKGASDAAFDLLSQAYLLDTTHAAIQGELGQLYFMQGFVEPAYFHLGNAVRLAPENYYYSLLFANLLQRMGETDKTSDLYLQMIAKNPDKPELYYMLSELYANAGELRKAIGALDSMQQSMGVIEPLSIEKYKLYHTLGEADKGFEEIESLIAAYPEEARYRVLLGNLYLEENQPDSALLRYDEAARLDPTNGYLILSRTHYLEKTGEKEQALNYIEQALVDEQLGVDTKIELLTQYGSNLFEQKENTASLYRLLDRILYLHPQEAALHTRYALFLLADGKDSLALKQFEIVTDLQPTDLKAWISLIGISFSRQNFAQATQYGLRALQYLPEEISLYQYTGIAQGQLGDRAGSLKTLEKGLSYISADNYAARAEFYGQIGDVLHQSGERKEAYEAYDKALGYNPNNVLILNNYSYFLALDKEDLGKAERMSGRAIQQEPNNPTYLDTYAWVYFQQGNYRLARFYLESALAKGGDKNPEILEHYGDTLYQLGEKEEALLQWNKAREAGGSSALLLQKIQTQTYHEHE